MHHGLLYGKKYHMTQLSEFKSQASRTDVSLFRSDRLNENIFFLFVSSIFYSLRFRHFGRSFSFRTVDLSRRSLVLPPTQQFLRTRINITFRGRCQPRKLKISSMFFRQNRENLATRKFPIKRYHSMYEINLKH